MTRGKLSLVSVLIILVMGGAAGFYWLGSGSRQASYRTVAVEQGDILSTISSTGTLNAVITVQVGTQVSGTIQQLFVDYNSPVKKGMLIARIDPATFEAKVNQAKADVESAQATVLNQRAAVAKAQADLANARANVVKDDVAVRDAKIKADSRVRLFQEGGISEEERDTAKATLDSAVAQSDAAQASVRSSQAALEVTQAQLTAAQAQVRQKQAALAQAQVDLDNSSIRAPVDGIVVARNVDVGQTVAASLQAPTLFLIAQDLTKMQVDTNVDEADIGRVTKEQTAAFTVDAYPGERFRGQVVQVRQAPQVVQNVVTYDVVVAVGNPDLKLKPGMTANVRIMVARHDGVLTIPNAAFRVRVDTPGAAGSRAGGSPGQGASPGAARAATGPGGRGAGAGAGASVDSGKQRVWVLENGRPVERRIQTGLSDGEKTEVVDGLKSGESIIIGVSGGQKSNGTSGPGGPPRVRL
ncbi:MAG TPA: efflux RND transporter periplasmic adaptor subunit [Candidatus Acidoferrum sp.]|nr:efflux RND transporter periplasmic adaptor subunit [Candidatus Acidoferrum sp.]